jgi:uncharacterized protein (DUF1684 family)
MISSWQRTHKVGSADGFQEIHKSESDNYFYSSVSGAGCLPDQTPKVDAEKPNYAKAMEKWRAERLAEINGEDGWTTLVGLFWLKPGSNKIGSDPSNDIVLPRPGAQKFVGSIILAHGIVRLEADPKAGITSGGRSVTSMDLQSDEKGKPTSLLLGSLTLLVIKRGERLGLRVKDNRHPARANFAGLEYFPLNLKWNLKATFLPYSPHKSVAITNLLGMVEDMVSPGALVFEIDGNSYRLDPVLEKGSNKLFVIFSDKTAGKETYGAGRYLYADPPGADGKVTVDFNKAHNPPCAFTKFATCPFPPAKTV